MAEPFLNVLHLMLVSTLKIENFRNLRQIALQCSPGMNLIVGENAAGKTSFLEALYFLGRARSFRTRQTRQLIRNGESAFRMVATVSNKELGRDISVGIQRSLQEAVIRIDGMPARSIAQLATQVPVLLLNTNSHRLIENGPRHRRNFMNWGLFHTDRNFWQIWKRYSTALRSRNAALRANYPNRAVEVWDRELAMASTALGHLQSMFCEALRAALTPFIDEILGKVGLEVNYCPGWPQRGDQGLMELLRSSRDQDRRYGYTRFGSHRADFQIRFAGQLVSEYLSRGQQKLLVIALILAQAHLYQAHRRNPCILLIDDLPAELDGAHRNRVMRSLARMDAQFFITTIERELLDTSAWRSADVFKLEHGDISKMI